MKIFFVILRKSIKGTNEFNYELLCMYLRILVVFELCVVIGETLNHNCLCVGNNNVTKKEQIKNFIFIVKINSISFSHAENTNKKQKKKKKKQPARSYLSNNH